MDTDFFTGGNRGSGAEPDKFFLLGLLVIYSVVRKGVNKFVKFLFPQTGTLEAKRSENHNTKSLAGGSREKTGGIRDAHAKEITI